MAKECVGDVAFSEASKVCALEFLEKFTSAAVLPGPDDPLPIGLNWPKLEQCEVEGESLDVARRYLAGK